jgi:hypothetical protein
MILIRTGWAWRGDDLVHALIGLRRQTHLTSSTWYSPTTSDKPATSRPAVLRTSGPASPGHRPGNRPGRTPPAEIQQSPPTVAKFAWRLNQDTAAAASGGVRTPVGGAGGGACQQPAPGDHPRVQNCGAAPGTRYNTPDMRIVAWAEAQDTRVSSWYQRSTRRGRTPRCPPAPGPNIHQQVHRLDGCWASSRALVPGRECEEECPGASHEHAAMSTTMSGI